MMIMKLVNTLFSPVSCYVLHRSSNILLSNVLSSILSLCPASRLSPLGTSATTCIIVPGTNGR
jgi:hypothetical protein